MSVLEWESRHCQEINYLRFNIRRSSWPIHYIVAWNVVTAMEYSSNYPFSKHMPMITLFASSDKSSLTNPQTEYTI